MVLQNNRNSTRLLTSKTINQPLTQQVVVFGVLLVLLLDTALGPVQGKGPPLLSYTAHVRTTVMALVAGPLLVALLSPGAVTVALVVYGPSAIGRTTKARVLLPPTAMLVVMLWLPTQVGS